MRNIKLEIEYDGANYCGWQIQSSPTAKKAKTIQEAIEKTLSRILQEKVSLIASGRTDAGVHALAQTANFKTNSSISLEKLQRALNGLLPDDIVITKAEEAAIEFHSRFNVKSKLYRYTILNSAFPSAFLKNKVYFYRHPLDIRLMQKASQQLLGRHNFKGFCASASSVKDKVRTIKRISVKKVGARLSVFGVRLGNYSLITIDIEADGFLYNMARNIVGTLIEIGRGKLPIAALNKILLSGDRKLAGPTVPANGLCLLKVKY